MKDYYEEYWKNSEEAGPNKDPTTPERIKILKKEIKKGKKVLDVGCADGLITNQISNGNQVYGIDISENAIKAAKKKYKKINFKVCEAEKKYPFKKEEFDVVFSGDVIEHVPEPVKMIKEINRVLKKNGKIIITTPYHGFWKNLAIILFRFDNHFDPEGPHLRFFTMNSMRKILKKNGFKVKRTYYVGRFYPFSKDMIVVAKKEL